MGKYSDNDIEDIEDIDIDDLTEFSVTVDQLVGRNFYHYTDGNQDKEHPTAYEFPDFSLDESDDDDDDSDSDEENELNEYLPEECWVKRYVDLEDPSICYIVYLDVDEDGSIVDSGCVQENTWYSSINSFFIIPGAEPRGEKSYESIYYPPDNVKDDIILLLKDRAIPPKFSFIGKKLPQDMIISFPNGSIQTQYTYALQSAYRLAYMHMTVDVDEKGIIKELTYSSWKSSGSGYGDMFSRPTSYPDREDEAMDMILHLYDMYTDEEISTL